MILNEAVAGYNERHAQAPIGLERPGDGDLLLSLSGELENKAAGDLSTVLETALQVCQPRGKLILDLRGVGYISSIGVGLLSSVMVAAERRSIKLVLLDVPPRVKNIMDTLGLLSYFNVEESGA